MTINENATSNIDHDTSIKDAIDCIFEQPEETYEMLEHILLGSQQQTQETHITGLTLDHQDNDNATSSSETSSSSTLSEEAFGDDESLEEFVLEEENRQDMFSDFDNLPDMSLLKVDNFIDETDVTNHPDQPSVNPVFECPEDNTMKEKENKFENNCSEYSAGDIVFPQLIMLNSVMSYDPFPGEAVESHVIDCESWESHLAKCTDKLENLPVLASSCYNEIDTSKNDSGFTQSDSVVPFELDESHNFDKYIHTPKFGQEIKNILFDHKPN